MACVADLLGGGLGDLQGGHRDVRDAVPADRDLHVQHPVAELLARAHGAADARPGPAVGTPTAWPRASRAWVPARPGAGQVSAADRVWKPSTPENPATVPARTSSGARFMAVLRLVIGRTPRGGWPHRGRRASAPASTISVTNPSGPHTYTSRSLRSGTMRRSEYWSMTASVRLPVSSCSWPPRRLTRSGDLRAEHEVLPPGGPQHDHRLGAARQVFQQRPHRGDPDPGGDQHRSRPPLGMPGEHAVRSLDGDPGARLEPGQRRGVVADPLDGQPQVGRLRQRGQRVGVGLPPHAPGQEAPEEELPAGHRQPVQVLAPADDRHHAGSFRVAPRPPAAGAGSCAARAGPRGRSARARPCPPTPPTTPPG